MTNPDTTPRILGGLLLCSAVLNACLLMSNGGYVRENRELSCENVQLRQHADSLQKRLDWWECKPESASLPSPVEIDPPIPAEVVPDEELAERVDAPMVVGATPGQRSGKWATVRNKFLAEHPFCCVCGKDAQTAHHAKPFHLYPELELEPSNLRPFCDRCHLVFGHLFNFQNENKDIDKHIKIIREAKDRADAERKARKTTVAP